MKPLSLALLCALATPAAAGPGSGDPVESEARPLSAILADDVTMKFFGRLNMDWTWMSGGDDGLYDTDDGVEFRRARMGVGGVLFDLVDYKAEFDFVDEATALKDVYMEVSDTGIGDVKVGHFKEPMSIEELTSSRFLTFLERGLPNVFVPSRNSGLQVSDATDSFGWAVGVFRDTDDAGNDNAGDEPDAEHDAEYAFTGRVYGTPVHDEGGSQVLHVGGSYSLRQADDGMVRYRQRPEAHLTNRPVDTGTLTADQVDLGGLEIAYVGGPFSAQAEYMMASVDGGSGGMDADFSGYYGEVSYFLTGEHRAYKSSSGAFDRIKPADNVQRGHWSGGAWQIAARYSMLDLTDGSITGGEMTDITLGATWILNPNARILFNLIHSETDQGSVEDDAMIGLIRFQVDW